MDNINFELDEVESQRAADFITQHNHQKELKREGKLAFTTLGMQFSYIITPGGLGNDVIIKCNYCGVEKNITNVDSW